MPRPGAGEDVFREGFGGDFGVGDSIVIVDNTEEQGEEGQKVGKGVKLALRNVETMELRWE